MKKPNQTRINGIYARLNRIERKCDCIISYLSKQIREPRQNEIDSIIANLRATAKSIAAECDDERKFFAKLVNRYKR